MCQKIVSKREKKEKEKKKKRKKVTRVVNMLINSWTRFLLVLKKTGGFLEIKERGEKKKKRKEKEKRKNPSRMKPVSRSKFYYALPSSSLGDPLTNFDFSQLFDVEI